MTFAVHTLASRPALRRHFERLHAAAWPPFLVDDQANALWGTLYQEFPEFQIALVTGAGRVVAVGNSIPFAWDGTAAGLPASIAAILRRAIADRRRGRPPNTLSALAAIVDARQRGQGWSARVITAMSRLAAGHGLAAFVAPVRPSLKGRYPLVSMTRYVRWRDPAGGPLDPWLRVHWRLGARVVRVVPRGNTVRATVAQWEERTGLRFRESGRFVVPAAFQPIRVDRARDRVDYAEANVWMRHPAPARQPAPRPRPAPRRPEPEPRRRPGTR
jgi:hypothetical protein